MSAPGEFRYQNMAATVMQCSPTFYTIYFDSQRLSLMENAQKYQNLLKLCHQAELQSQGILKLDTRYLDSGLLIVKRARTESINVTVEDLLRMVANAIADQIY